ncbi:hypothetical protein GY45DRAFT_450575 [Cubamyces sp. BRFM 1775]|nr:hypothetical protein GY45DRAFT_450575 [Cubamyces sp. BRFM 1775]
MGITYNLLVRTCFKPSADIDPASGMLLSVSAPSPIPPQLATLPRAAIRIRSDIHTSAFTRVIRRTIWQGTLRESELDCGWSDVRYVYGWVNHGLEHSAAESVERSDDHLRPSQKLVRRALWMLSAGERAAYATTTEVRGKKTKAKGKAAGKGKAKAKVV